MAASIASVEHPSQRTCPENWGTDSLTERSAHPETNSRWPLATRDEGLAEKRADGDDFRIMRRALPSESNEPPGRGRNGQSTGAGRQTGAGSRRASRSRLREVIPSLANTLCRWYSAVRELMKS